MGSQDFHTRLEGKLSGFVRSLLGNLPWSDRLEAEQVMHFPTPAEGIVRIHDGNGSMSITGEDRDDIELRVVKIARAESEEGAQELLEGMHVVPAEVAGALELEVAIPQKWNRRGTVNLEMRVPRALSVELSAVNGRIDVEGMRGMVRARSSNGSATIRDVVGDISVSTCNAKVACMDTHGRLVARSRDGKIELHDHSGSIDASTSNGLIRASLEEVGDDGISLATSNGRIILDLPDDVDAEVDVRVDNGSIRNDLQDCHCTRASNGRILGRLGAGGALIKLRTSNGSVCLR